MKEDKIPFLEFTGSKENLSEMFCERFPETLEGELELKYFLRKSSEDEYSLKVFFKVR